MFKFIIKKLSSATFFNNHQSALLYGTCVILLASYMLVFQADFTLTGDTWAEAFPEYVNDVLTKEPSDILDSSWAGYLTVVPAFLTQLYISSPLPLGDIDYYFRFTTLAFAILCCAFIAHPFNRQFVRSDILRFFLAFLVLFSICHVSSLAFINIWYIGFIVIILICAGSRQLSPPKEVVFTIFTILISVSKPSLIILPFIAYRLARQLHIHKLFSLCKSLILKQKTTKKQWLKWLHTSWKQYKYSIVGSLLIIVVIAYETYLTVFGENGFSGGSVTTTPLLLTLDTLLASGTLLLKALHIPAANIGTVTVSAIIVLALFILLFRRSKLFSLALGVTLAFGIYLHIYSPDNTLNNVWSNFSALYSDKNKLQRELLPVFILLFVLFINLGILFQQKIFTNKRHLQPLAAITLILLFVVIVRPWGTIITAENGRLYSISIDGFRDSLNTGQPVCMPVAPTTFLDNSANWFFQYNGGCYQLNQNDNFSLNSFTTKLSSSDDIQLPGGSQNRLKTVIIPIKASSVSKQDTLTITDIYTGNSYSSPIHRIASEYQQVSFNVATLNERSSSYVFKVHSNNQSVYIGHFDSGSRLVYGLYIGSPN